MRDLYYILDEYRRKPIVVSKRHWRRWMYWNNRDDEIGVVFFLPHAPIAFSYTFHGRAPLGANPPLVWRVSACIPSTERPDPSLPDHISFALAPKWWTPEPFGLDFEEIRDFPTEGLARSGMHEMRDRIERRLREYEKRGGIVPPPLGRDDDDGEAWKRG